MLEFINRVSSGVIISTYIDQKRINTDDYGKLRIDSILSPEDTEIHEQDDDSYKRRDEVLKQAGK